MELPPSIVAVVEDDPSMRRSVRRLLNAYGFVTEEFSSAEAFLSRDAASKVECLVLDIDLGGMSGIELQRRLRDCGSKLPVIFITALEESAVKADAVQAGCIAYLHKPFPGALLINAVNKALAASTSD
ncbi:response regulator transcription factor [Rhizobium pisi]|uniref:response regulator transcription factor n=1 Tax=Rhizobium pisi TaxID=574561 RepID=UPI0039B0F5A0